MSDRILRLQHVQVRVPDLELCTAYYTEVLGLVETAHEEGRVFLKCWDEHEHHSVVLRQAPTYGLDHMSFKLAEQGDLDYYAERVEQAGLVVKRYGRGELGPGWGEAIRFDAPSGHTVELVWDMEKVGNMLPLFNPPPRPGNLVGIAPPRLDHLFIMAEDVEGATRFYCDVLEFRLTEQIIANDGHQLATWMERSHSPHDLAIVTGPNGALHHFAFWLDDWNAVREAADTLAFNGVTIDVAPTRHGATRATPSTSSTRWATATSSSRAATGSIPTSSRSPGPRRRWVGRSSTTTARSTSASSRCTRDHGATAAAGVPAYRPH